MTLLPKHHRLSWMPKPRPREAKDFGHQEEEQKKFYNSRNWRYKIRRPYLSKNPYCVKCKEKDYIVLAEIVDHVIPIKQGGAMRDERNFQSLCKDCHNVKRGQEAHMKIKNWILNENNEKIPIV